MRSTCGRSASRFRGLTVVDTVVSLVVVVFLVFGLLAPMLARAQVQSARDICYAHLGAIGKAMLTYAHDYDGYFPRAGGCDANWAPVIWNASTRKGAYGTTDGQYPASLCPGCFKPDPNGFVPIGGNCTISSCLYLLVKYAGVDPNQFVCPQDPNTSAFALDMEDPNCGITKLTQAWDFGSKPQWHCSYAYQAPWSTYALRTTDDPNFAFAADRNPWLDSPGFKKKEFPAGLNAIGQTVFFRGRAGNDADQRYGNSSVHNEDGQNVLFVDGHVSFETRAYCSLEGDNIYTVSALVSLADPLGSSPLSYAPHLYQKGRKDSLLVHDPPDLSWSTPAGGK
jgi:prepilin-type processing-associated H-X9-DG protein